MDTLLGAPAVVLVALSIASALLVIEVALPTFGVAGTTSFALAGVAVAGIARQHADWWPLLGPGAAVLIWSALIARRQRSLSVEVLAGLLFAAGSVAFGILADSAGTAIFGLGFTVVVSVAYPRLHAAAARLADSPARVGMASLVGERGVVVAWKDAAGTVRLQGSLWSAVSASPDIAPNIADEVEIVGFAGMTVKVANGAHRAAQL